MSQHKNSVKEQFRLLSCCSRKTFPLLTTVYSLLFHFLKKMLNSTTRNFSHTAMKIRTESSKKAQKKTSTSIANFPAIVTGKHIETFAKKT